jgi:DNA-binding beta-propeller fold protein YncE
MDTSGTVQVSDRRLHEMSTPQRPATHPARSAVTIASTTHGASPSMGVPHRTWATLPLTTVVVATLLGVAASASALIITGGPTYSLPGGGVCSISGVTSRTGGATISCTDVNLAAHTNVYLGMRVDTDPNGNTMTGSDPAASSPAIFRFSSSTGNSITYTSTTAVTSVSGFGTDTVSNKLILTLIGGIASVVDTNGIPANSVANGDIGNLFRLESGNSFAFRADVRASDSDFSEGQACPALYDPVHAAAGGNGERSRVDVAFYYSDCGDGVIDSPEVCDGGDCCNPNCTFRPSGTVCRAAVDLCDAQEVCSGAASTCPVDAKVPSGTTCRAEAAGICDVEEVCDGSADTCPADVFVPLENLVYVTTTDGIALIDTRTQADRCGTVELPKSPAYLALSPDGGTIYATAESDAIYSVDTATRSLRDTIPGDPRYSGVAFSPAGDIVYALRSRFGNGPISAISLIDPSIGSITSNIPLFTEQLETEVVTRLAVRADGRKAYVPLTFANSGRFDITVVDLERNRRETTIPIPCGQEMIDLAFAPSSSLLYVPVLGSASCSQAGGTAGEPVCPGDCGGDGEVTVPEIIVAVRIALGESTIDACRAASSGDSVRIPDLLRAVNSLLMGCPEPGIMGDFTAVIDTDQQTLIKVIPIGNAATGARAIGGVAGAQMVSGLGIAISPDGAFAYITRCGDGVCVLDLATEKVVDTVTVRGLPYNIDLSADGRTAYVTELASERLFVIDLDGGDVLDSIAIPQAVDVVVGR